MNRASDVDRVLRDYLADDGGAAPDYVLDVVQERIRRQPQRRTWPFLRRTNMTTQIKLIAALAAVLVVAVVGYNLLPGGSTSGGPGGSPSIGPTTGPTALSTPVATGPIVLPEGTLESGRYRMDLTFVDPGLSVIAEIPAKWVGHPEVPALTSPEGSNAGVLISFMETDGLFSDPCHWDLDGTGNDAQPGDVDVGPTVEDLVTALRSSQQESYTASTASPVSIGGFEGSELELQLPGNDVIATCDRRPGESSGDYFVFPLGFYAQGPNSRWRLNIVDVDGTRLIIMISIAEGTPQADILAAEAIVDSFEITP